MNTFFKRILFCMTMTAVFVVTFPLLAGIPFTFQIISIPFLYVFLFIPAALTGITASIIMLFFKNTFRLGSFYTAFLCSVLGSIYTGLPIFLFFHKAIAILFSPSQAATSAEGIIDGLFQALIIISFTFIVAAGGITSLLIQGKKMDSLLGD